MSLPAILTQVAAVAGTVTGIVKSLPYPPDAITEDRTAVTHVLGTGIESGTQIGLEVSTYDIAVRVYVTKVGPSIEASSAALVVFEQDLRTAFRSHVQLNGSCNSSEVTASTFGTVIYAGAPWLTVELKLEVTDKQVVTYAA